MPKYLIGGKFECEKMLFEKVKDDNLGVYLNMYCKSIEHCPTFNLERVSSRIFVDPLFYVRKIVIDQDGMGPQIYVLSSENAFRIPIARNSKGSIGS
jgi:hypothetical protein